MIGCCLFAGMGVMVVGVNARPAEDGQGAPPNIIFMMEFDWAVGLVMAKLDELGLADNTLLIVTSDNGGLPPRATRIPEEIFRTSDLWRDYKGDDRPIHPRGGLEAHLLAGFRPVGTVSSRARSAGNQGFVSGRARTGGARTSGIPYTLEVTKMLPFEAGAELFTDRSGHSQAATLRAQGFVKVDGADFPLWNDRPGNRSLICKKECEHGEMIRFGLWAVPGLMP